jgi:hypothetical protein
MDASRETEEESIPSWGTAAEIGCVRKREAMARHRAVRSLLIIAVLLNKQMIWVRQFFSDSKRAQ